LGSCRQVVLLANRHQTSLHTAVAECAVVSIEDELRGQVTVGFAVLKDGTNISQDQSTIDDPAILGEICQVLESCGIGKFVSKS